MLIAAGSDINAQTEDLAKTLGNEKIIQLISDAKAATQNATKKETVQNSSSCAHFLILEKCSRFQTNIILKRRIKSPKKNI
jgi:hypothetical protein